MPVVLGQTMPAPPVMPPRKRWTRQEIEIFERAGAMEGQHFELIEGDLINKMGKYLRHAMATRNVAHLLGIIFGWRLVLQETSMDVAPEDHPTSDPEPDVIVLNRDASEIRGNEPEASDVVLVVEVSDTTLKFDVTTKAALYARASIAEYWVLDLNGSRLIVHRDPVAGSYKSVVAYSVEERVTPLAAPAQEVAIADLFA
jgi:Uma2 family endonuclease